MKAATPLASRVWQWMKKGRPPVRVSALCSFSALTVDTEVGWQKDINFRGSFPEQMEEEDTTENLLTQVHLEKLKK